MSNSLRTHGCSTSGLPVHHQLSEFTQTHVHRVSDAIQLKSINSKWEKEYIWISSNEVDETGAYYREWSKPERTPPIEYTNIYMELRKMVTITLYTRQQKRHWCIEQSYGLCGRGRRWEDLGEWHWNLYNIMYETSHQSSFDALYWMLGAGTLGWPRGMVWGGRREEGSAWGTRVYLWWIPVDIWQNQ